MADLGLMVDGTAEDAVQLTVEALERHGFRVVRSFDLRSALDVQGLPCPCPYHSTRGCECNYVVLLAYPPTEPDRPECQPGQIVIHSHDGSTWLSLSAPADASDITHEVDTDPRLLRALAEVLQVATV